MPVNNFDQNYVDNLYLPSSHQVIRALGRLQTQTGKGLGGSIYVYDLIEQRTLCSSYALFSMLGYNQEQSQQLEQLEPFGLANLIYPDDLHRVADHYQRFTTLHPTQVITVHYRMKHADGSWRWLRSQETPLVNAIDGFPLQILGIVSLVDAPVSLGLRRRRLLRSKTGKSRRQRSFRPRSPYLITQTSANPPSSPPSRPTP